MPESTEPMIPDFDRAAWTEMFVEGVRKMNADFDWLRLVCALAKVGLQKTGQETELKHLVGMVCHMLSVFSPVAIITDVFDEGEDEKRELEARFRVWHLRSMPYKEYLESPWWQERRKTARKSANDQCQVCNSPDHLNVHHRTYERLGEEIDTDLLVLCRKCHYLFHQNGKLAKPERK